MRPAGAHLWALWGPQGPHAHMGPIFAHTAGIFVHPAPFLRIQPHFWQHTDALQPRGQPLGASLFFVITPGQMDTVAIAAGQLEKLTPEGFRIMFGGPGSAMTEHQFCRLTQGLSLIHI